MRSLRFAVLALLRDWRSGELGVLVAALLVAVAALTGVGFFTDRISQAVDRQAAEVIAADLRLQGSQAPAEAYAEAARQRGIATARTVSFPSVVFRGETSSLTAIRATGAGYPLRGTLRIADGPFEPARETKALPAAGEAWLDARLLARLGAAVGDEVRIGAASFRVAQVLDYRPDQGSAFVDLASTLLMNIDDLPATQLLQPGSRATHALLFAGGPSAIRGFKPWIEARKKPGERLVDVAEASPQIQSATERAGRFLNLSALITVLLAAVAVAMSARRYARRHLDNVELMKCMGASQGFVLRVSVLQLVALALLATAAGSALGWIAQEGLAWLLRDLVRSDLPPPTLAPVALGLVTSLAILVGFALPPLLQLRRVSPARVLRKNLEPPALRYWVSYGLAVAALLGMLFWLVRDARLVMFVGLGAAATLALLSGAGWLLVKGVGRLRGGVGVAWRYGLANVARRGAESVAQVIAFGLGLMVLLLLALVRNDLVEEWQASLPTDTPNHFLINIREQDRAPLSAFFAARGVAEPVLFPMIRARLTAVNGRPVRELKLAGDRGRGFAEREQNLTWSGDLPSDNQLVAGRWWGPADAGRRLVSVSTEYQQELGLKVGDRLAFDVAGEPLEAEVASVRKVQWDSFRPNFFLVFSPGTLDGMVGTYLTAVKLDVDQRRMLADLVRQFPGISVFDVDAILKQVRDVMDRASLAVQYVFLFTLLAGVTVLLAAVQSTRDERLYESAMLRTLGASRRTVLAGVAAEFTTLGLLAGLLAAAGATAGGYFIATELFSLAYRPNAWVWIAGLGGGALLVGGAGTLAARGVVNHPPAASLRQG